MQVTTGRIVSAQKVVIYGPEGIGKSTFASKFPNPLFIDTEGSTKKLDVARLPKPGSWTMLLEEVRHVKSNPGICGTLVIDTADWAERLCAEHICSKSQKSGIEDFGYGKGYTYLEEEFGRLLNLLEEVVETGINVVITAHAQMRKFEQPDELGAYDRWELKLEKKTAPLLKEWADMVLFANYETHVVNVDGQGAQKGKNKAQGGKRVMYTTHHSCWDAKNRDELPDKLPFEYSAIASCIPEKRTNTAHAGTQQPKSETMPPKTETPPVQTEQPKTTPVEARKEDPTPPPVEQEKASPPADPPKKDGKPVVLPRALAELMAKDGVYPEEIQWVVAVKGNGGKGYYPIDTPIENYDPEFVKGALVGMWPQIFGFIKQKRLDEEWKNLQNNNEKAS